MILKLHKLCLLFVALWIACGKSKFNRNLSQIDLNDAQQECQQLKDNITYIPESLMRLPPLLLSLPGSGNTWVRLLIELSTGYYTGAIYDDLSLQPTLKGEKTCGRRTVAVKAHPLDVEVIPHLQEIKIPGHKYKKKCSKGSITGFKRVILLVREPYASILADSQQGLTLNHTGALTKEQFAVNNQSWRELSMRQSYRIFNNSRNVLFPLMDSFNKQDILIIRYENLVNPTTRIQEMHKVLAFVEFPVVPRRIECAFEMSDADRAIHREKKITLNDTFGAFPHHTCSMWPFMRNFSEVFGYSNIFSHLCHENSQAS